ncbi:MAG TPA: DUF268 domain-containing protein [Bellilinea sp.]|nr:DUF268 domain-containing protein [Bellilinea sp.]
MKRLVRSIYSLFVLFGFDPLKMIRSMRGLPTYLRGYKKFKEQGLSARKAFPFGKPYPCLSDRFVDSGSAKGHYFHQDLLVARRIFSNNPSQHVDVGSRIDGFVAHVASFRPIEVVDIRQLPGNIPNVTFRQADMMLPIHEDFVGYCDSLSCLHAIEHFGLGRYGDPINYDGHILALENLYLMLKKGGKFYFSSPIGPQRIEFNAHRVFSISYLLDCFANKFSIDCFSFVDDRGDLHENKSITFDAIRNNFGCVYGCGIFELTKL